MKIHTKTLAGEPSVSLIECPSAGTNTNIWLFSKEPGQMVRELTASELAHREEESFKDCLFHYIGACVDRTWDQCNFVTCDLTEVSRRKELWAQQLPRVTPFYAVKCNPDPPLLKLLSTYGVNFDCASKGEIEQVLKLGVDPSRVIFANAVKFVPHVRYARNVGVRRATVDCENELIKLAKEWPGVECVLRILPQTYEAQCQLKTKFGARVDLVPALLAKARELDLNVVGISFHVGSGCYEDRAWAESVRLAKRVSEQFSSYGFEMKLLDIGGGFPGNSADLGMPNQPKFENICAHLRDALDEEFPEASGVEIIAEPGRFFAASMYTLATQVYSMREVDVEEDEQNKRTEEKQEKKKKRQVYVGDGVYGTFNNVVFDHQTVQLSAIITPCINTDRRRNSATESDTEHEPAITNGSNNNTTDEIIHRVSKLKEPASGDKDGDSTVETTTIFGPSCDGFDALEVKNIPPLAYNDWLVWRDMGAYTIACSSSFNGMPRPKLYYFLFQPTEGQLKVIREALELGEPEDDNPTSSVIIE